MNRLALFDCDGTLVDSGADICAAMDRSFAAEDLPPPPHASTRAIVGLSLSDIKELLDLYDVGDGRRTQRLKTVERCQAKVDALQQQRIDIDATIDELTNFIALVKAQTDQEG